MTASTSPHSDSPEYTPKEACEQFAAELLSRRSEKLKSDAARRPQHVPRASGVDKCARAMYYQITAWGEAEAFTEHSIARMQRGTELEERIIAPEMAMLGFRWMEAQRYLELRDDNGRLIMTGHIDGLVLWKGVKLVADIKTMNPNLWGTIDSVHDLLRNEWFYRYPLQLLAYMMAYGLESGLLIIDDCLGHWKTIPVHLADHRELADEVKQRCTVVVDACEREEAPDFIDDASVCARCWWKKCGTCQPPMDYANDVRTLPNQDLEQDLRTIEAYEEQGKQRDAAKRRFSKVTSELEDGQYLCGPFLIELTRKPRKGYVVQDGTTVNRTTTRIAEDKPDALAEQLRASKGGAA